MRRWFLAVFALVVLVTLPMAACRLGVDVTPGVDAGVAIEDGGTFTTDADFGPIDGGIGGGTDASSVADSSADDGGFPFVDASR